MTQGEDAKITDKHEWKARWRHLERVLFKQVRDTELAQTVFEELWVKAKPDIDTVGVSALSFATLLGQVEEYDRLILAADKRRDSLLREIERRRDQAASRFSVAVDEAVDADFTPHSPKRLGDQ